MINKGLKYVFGIGLISICCIYGVNCINNVLASKDTSEDKAVYVEAETNNRKILNDIGNKEQSITSDSKENNESQELGELEEKIYDELGNEIITTGDEYDYPINKEICVDTVVVNQDLLNGLLNFKNYKSYNIKVRDNDIDDYDVQMSVDIYNKLTGRSADEILEKYNRYVKARYLIDVEDGWENVLIPFKLSYKNAVKDTDDKIEPNLRVYEACNYGIIYKNLDYVPCVTTLYILKSREERLGYIAVKLPIVKVNNCTLEIQNRNTDNIKIKLDGSTLE